MTTIFADPICQRDGCRNPTAGYINANIAGCSTTTSRMEARCAEHGGGGRTDAPRDVDDHSPHLLGAREGGTGNGTAATQKGRPRSRPSNGWVFKDCVAVANSTRGYQGFWL